MPNDNHDLRALWQAADGPKISMSIEQLKAKESAFSRRVKWRNLRETLASAILVVWCAWRAAHAASLLGASGALALAFAALFVGWRLLRDGSPLPPLSADSTFLDTLAHHRASLVKQRDLLRSVPRWYLGPLYVAVLWQLIVDVLLKVRGGGGWMNTAHGAAVRFVLVALAFSAVMALNFWAAKRLDRKIDALDHKSL